jgi:hypothetical protein
MPCVDREDAKSDENIVAEKRRAHRKNVSIPCALRIMGKVYAGRMRDLSSSGAFIQTEQTVACGDKISIIFDWRPKGKPAFFSVRAQVVYAGRFIQGFVNFYGFGASFTHLSANHVAKLNEIMDALTLEPERKYEFY